MALPAPPPFPAASLLPAEPDPHPSATTVAPPTKTAKICARADMDRAATIRRVQHGAHRGGLTGRADQRRGRADSEHVVADGGGTGGGTDAGSNGGTWSPRPRCSRR